VTGKGMPNLLAADGRGWCSNDRGDVVKKAGERGR